MRATDPKVNPTSGPGEVPRTEPSIDILPEELRHLAECCAFFKAEHFREAAPETIRRADIFQAEVELEQAIESCGCCGVKRNRETTQDR